VPRSWIGILGEFWIVVLDQLAHRLLGFAQGDHVHAFVGYALLGEDGGMRAAPQDDGAARRLAGDLGGIDRFA
jgi:hypothetical protein